MKRRFVKESSKAILIEDSFETSDSTRFITWGMMTVADVQPIQNGAILTQEGKELKLTILEPGAISVSVISLDPPPLKIDKTIKNLKRIEIQIPAWKIENGIGKIRVRLSGT